jgi:hypothetical protein
VRRRRHAQINFDLTMRAAADRTCAAPRTQWTHPPPPLPLPYMSTPMLGLGFIDAWEEYADGDGSDSPASEQHLVARRSEGNINAAAGVRPPALARPAAATSTGHNQSSTESHTGDPVIADGARTLLPPPLRRARSQTQTLGEGWRRGTGRGRVVFMRGRTLRPLPLLLLPLLQ